MPVVFNVKIRWVSVETSAGVIIILNVILMVLLIYGMTVLIMNKLSLLTLVIVPLSCQPSIKSQLGEANELKCSRKTR